MRASDDKHPEPGPAASLKGLVRASRRLSAEPDPVQALWTLVCALRDDLGIDRAGVFAYDAAARTLSRVIGVDRKGGPEFEGDVVEIELGDGPMRMVARRELPYYITDDVRRDFPHLPHGPGDRALAVIPILAGDELLGALCADNHLTDRALPETVLEPLFLYAGLAALPLFAMYQKQERERAEALRRQLYREVFLAVTNSRVRLCDQEEIQVEWPGAEHGIPVREERDIRIVREEVRRVCREAGMDADRTGDLCLCASEAATNALLHGNGGAASVGWMDNHVRVRVMDRGQGIALEHLPRAALQKGWSNRSSLGLGFTLIHETADCVYLHTGSEGTTLIVEMTVRPSSPELSVPLLCDAELEDWA